MADGSVTKTIKDWATRTFSVDADASSDAQEIKQTGVSTYKASPKGDGAAKNAAKAIQKHKKDLDDI